jgi:hypothetical protein
VDIGSGLSDQSIAVISASRLRLCMMPVQISNLPAGLSVRTEIRMMTDHRTRNGRRHHVTHDRHGATMASTVEELTIRYEEDGIETVKELDKQVLTKGAWSTVIFRYQDWDRAKQAYGPDKYSIRRYQKRNGEYQQKSKFNISSKDQAEKIIAALQSWIR